MYKCWNVEDPLIYISTFFHLSLSFSEHLYEYSIVRTRTNIHYRMNKYLDFWTDNTRTYLLIQRG